MALQSDGQRAAGCRGVPAVGQENDPVPAGHFWGKCPASLPTMPSAYGSVNALVSSLAQQRGQHWLLAFRRQTASCQDHPSIPSVLSSLPTHFCGERPDFLEGDVARKLRGNVLAPQMQRGMWVHRALPQGYKSGLQVAGDDADSYPLRRKGTTEVVHKAGPRGPPAFGLDLPHHPAPRQAESSCQTRCPTCLHLTGCSGSH